FLVFVRPYLHRDFNSVSVDVRRHLRNERSKGLPSMTAPGDSLPLSNHRARLAQYLSKVSFSSATVAGRIIEERPVRHLRDPLRPALVLWACEARNGDLDDAVPVAAAFDLFDQFLLLHEQLTRDSPTVERWGLGQSLNAGDALYALAFRSLAADVVN